MLKPFPHLLVLAIAALGVTTGCDAPTDAGDAPTDAELRHAAEQSLALAHQRAHSSAWGLEPVDGTITVLTAQNDFFAFHQATAEFSAATELGDECTVELVHVPGGRCSIGSCATPPAAEPVDVGDVRIYTPNELLTLEPDASGSYAPATGNTALWAGGEFLMYTTEGAPGVLPRWGRARAPMLTGAVLEPPIGPGGPVSIPRDEPLEVSWETGAPAWKTVRTEFNLSLSSMTDPVLIECSFPAHLEGGTIPTEVLDALPNGPGFAVAQLQDTHQREFFDQDYRFNAIGIIDGGFGPVALE